MYWPTSGRTSLAFSTRYCLPFWVIRPLSTIEILGSPSLSTSLASLADTIALKKPIRDAMNNVRKAIRLPDTLVGDLATTKFIICRLIWFGMNYDINANQLIRFG
ncbi:protein of unknown function [Vibrio tapetis subsp. tapetis]|uniref:Uncharacterized protein n=1 Tax=Vibrio tapetis subsp. tapetis TaxID=1671868 RepID=A0A2N8Z9F2_9VIBR|nr:protein of unknown function [Vibrio tapetis subsp. tapetis]